jgi:HAD superfamily hydrolase (TIGR01509 family)
MLVNTLSNFPKISDVQKVENLNTILFDLDGTLLDTEFIHAIALKNTLNFFVPENNFSDKDLQEKFNGMTDVDVYFKLKLDSVKLENFLKVKNDQFISIMKDNHNLLNSNIRNFLNDLKKEEYSMALVTASERDVAIALLEHTEIISLFDTIICRDDLEKSKPDPLPYITAMTRLGSSSKSTLIFEDSVTGLKAAESSKANYIKAEWFTSS